MGPDSSLKFRKNSSGLKHVFQALLHSLKGLQVTYRYEIAFKQEVFLAVILIPLACWLNVTTIERVLLITSILLILVVELLNSSIETLSDRISPESHPLSGRAKDQASAAVLLAFIICFITWCMILGSR